MLSSFNIEEKYAKTIKLRKRIMFEYLHLAILLFQKTHPGDSPYLA